MPLRVRRRRMTGRMDRHSVGWRGYIPALTTPFAANGALDRAGWVELVEWAVSEGVHGIVVAGSSGEWFSLEPQERLDLFQLARRQVNGRVPVIGCCNALRPTESLRYALAASQMGLDGIILAPPPYAVPNEDEVIAFYRWLLDQVPLPACLYNWPRGTNVDLSPELLGQLAEIETVVAVKNSTSSLASFVEAFFALKEQIRIFGFGSDDLSITLITSHGGDGTIGAGAVLGREHPAFWEALWRRKFEEARKWGARDKAFFDFSMKADFSPAFASVPAILKAALNLRGLPGGYPRPPYLPLTAEQAERVRRILQMLGLTATNPA
jgi:dihydrodipicolinate synthase/N-acetylneuraminate lyase